MGDVVISVNGKPAVGLKKAAVYSLIGKNGSVSLTLRTTADVEDGDEEGGIERTTTALREARKKGVLSRVRSRSRERNRSNGSSAEPPKRKKGRFGRSGPSLADAHYGEGQSETTAAGSIYSEAPYAGPREGSRHQLRALMKRTMLLQSRQRTQFFCSTIFCRSSSSPSLCSFSSSSSTTLSSTTTGRERARSATVSTAAATSPRS